MQNINTSITFAIALTIDLRKYGGDHPETAREQAFQRLYNKLQRISPKTWPLQKNTLHVAMFDLPLDEGVFASILDECVHAEFPYQTRYLSEFSRGGTATIDTRNA